MYKAFRFNYDPKDMTIQLIPEGHPFMNPLYIHPLGSEYETVKEISTEMQSTFWHKRQYAQGNSVQY